MALAISPDGKWAASAGIDRDIILWNLASGVAERRLSGHQGPVWSLRFAPEGDRLISAGGDEVVKVWDIARGIALGDRTRAPDPMAALLAKGGRGAKLFRKCQACHTVTRDGGHRAGPTLYGVFGRQAGTAKGYAYSKALRGSDLVWTERTVDALFAEGPDRFTPGSKMPLQRIPDPRDRAELIAFLKKIVQ